MGEFIRCLEQKRIDDLLNERGENGRIFQALLPQIMKGEIFLAIRDDKVDFYVGGNVFLSYYGNSFKANPKIFPNNKENQKDRMIKVKQVFDSGWENKIDELKNICLDYSSANAEQAERKIIQEYFPTYEKDEPVIVLDREIRINDGNGRKCDWLLFNKKTALLKFVEVKISNNSGLKKHQDGTFDVINQIDGYSKQYEKHETRIVEQYKEYASIINKLLGISLPEPKGMLDTKAGLAIFGKKSEIDSDLLNQISPFVGEYQPKVSASLVDIWDHFS